MLELRLAGDTLPLGVGLLYPATRVIMRQLVTDVPQLGCSGIVPPRRCGGTGIIGCDLT